MPPRNFIGTCVTGRLDSFSGKVAGRTVYIADARQVMRQQFHAELMMAEVLRELEKRTVRQDGKSYLRQPDGSLVETEVCL